MTPVLLTVRMVLRCLVLDSLLLTDEVAWLLGLSLLVSAKGVCKPDKLV